MMDITAGSVLQQRPSLTCTVHYLALFYTNVLFNVNRFHNFVHNLIRLVISFGDVLRFI